jgi:ATP-binding cassette subfamily B protein
LKFKKINSNEVESQPGIGNLIVRLWCHLTRRRQRQVGLLLVLMLVSASAEVVTVGAVIPFIGALAAPNRIFDQPIVRSMANALGIASSDQLILPFTIAFALTAITAGIIRFLLLWASTRLANVMGADLSTELYLQALYQPYRIQVTRNSSELISRINAKAWMAVTVIQSLLNLVASVSLVIFLVPVLMAIDRLAVTITAGVFIISYGFITRLSRARLYINSQRVAKDSTLVVKALQEGFGGIRDVILNGVQSVYSDIFRRADLPLRIASSSNTVIATCPKFAMEALAMVVLAGLAYGLNAKTGGFSDSFPVLGALALGAQRLLPALQQIYSSWASIAGSQASLTEVVDMLDLPLPNEATDPGLAPLEFKDSIRFESVRFRYLTDGPWVLDGLNFTIPKRSSVGFVGATGSGKSTTLDLLMGLLDPNEGQILVDGLSISGPCRRAWQRLVAHVPQTIFLADTTFSENIAFGVPLKDINMERVREVAHQAQIDDFIESSPEGYNTFVGERGIKLSGGQRQRVGIARALYKQASVLVFDEATSSLDNATEQAVMESIEKLNRDFTILIIAHRLTTVKRCDKIIELAHGRVVAQGSYEELLQTSPSFNRMVKAVA